MTYAERHAIYVAYLTLKVFERDWHGVSDAANDLRELEAMPSKSGRQHRAMEAAAHGRSTLGIPKRVAKEFVAADVGKHFGTKGKRK